MSSSWFNVEALQSSIMESVGEASKLMEELNLDNLQEDSGITNKENCTEDKEEVYTHSNYEDKEGTEDIPNSLSEQDLDSTDIHSEILPQDASQLNSNITPRTASHHTPAAGAVKKKPVIEMEAVTEFTEFGVPITIMQPKAVVSTSLSPPTEKKQEERSIEEEEKEEEEEEEEEGGEIQNIFSLWNLDSLQEPEEKKKPVVVASKAQSHDSQPQSHNSQSNADDVTLHYPPSHSSIDSTPPKPLNSVSNSRSTTLDKSTLPQYVNQSLLSDYLYPINNIFSEPVQQHDSQEDEEVEGCENMSDTGITTHEDESLHLNDFSDTTATVTATAAAAAISDATTFFGNATSTLLLNAKANIPATLFSRPSFFDDDSEDDDENNEGGTDTSFRKNDPIYQRVEHNKIHPPQPRSSQQSIFQSGSAFFASSAPVTGPSAPLTPAEVRRQSRAYGFVSKIITCVMWLLRLVWNILSAILAVVVSLLRSMFDCPNSPDSASLLPTTVANNFCEAMQHPVTRAQLIAEYRVYLFNIIVSNNFIAVMTTLLLAASYWKFRRYGTDSGD